MDAVLRMPGTGIGIAVPWKRILSGVLILLCCFVLYVCGTYRRSSYGEPAKGRVTGHRIAVLNAGVHLDNDYDLAKKTVVSPVPELSGKIEENTDILHIVPKPAVPEEGSATAVETCAEPVTVDPYVAVEADAAALEKPDESCSERIEISGFICDEDGYIVDHTDAVMVTDGILVLPTDERCRGIIKGALDGLGPDTTEIYIPANICRIEPGVFDGFASLIYIEAAGDNPSYYSSNGILYDRSGEMIVYPHGRPMEITGD